MNYSRQRESIKDFLSTRKDHPTADTIYMNIRKQFPNISLGTIYRNLNLLSDIGEITRLTTGDGCDHYDFNTAPHNHFVCTRCHSVLDLEMDSIDDIVEVAPTLHIFLWNLCRMYGHIRRSKLTEQVICQK